MASIGALVAELSANTASFQRDMGKAVSILNTSSAQMNRTIAGIEGRFRSLSASVQSFGAILGVSAFAIGTKAAYEYASGIGETAKTLGVSTDALQEFRFALKQSGADAGTADALLAKFSQTIGDAAEGSDTAQKALQRIGVTTADLKSKNIETLFSQATDNLSRFGSEADRNSAIADVFGKKALMVAGALSTSADEMAKLREQARQMGAVLSEQTIATAKEAKDKFDALSNVIKVQLTESIVNAGPSILRMSQFLADLATMANWALQRIGAVQASSASQQYDLMLQKRLDLTEKLAEVEQSRFAQKPDTLQFRQAEMYRKEIEATDKALGDLRKKMEEAPKTGKPGPAVLDVKVPEGQQKQFESLSAGLEKATRESQMAMTIDEGAKARMRMEIQQDEWRFKIEQAKIGTAERMDIEEKYSVWLEQAEKERAFRSRTPLQQLADDWDNTSKQLQNAQVKWANGFVDTLTDAVMTGKASFSDLANSIIRDLVRIAIQKFIVDTMFGGSGGGGGLVAIVSSVFGGGRASGGPVNAGVPYMVGEQGPELIIPKAAGTVIPNHNLMSANAGGATYYIDNRGADTAAVARLERTIIAINGSIENRAVNAVADARFRGVLKA